MPQYIRAFIPGGTFFFTVTLLERRRKLLTENIDNLREVFKAARRRRPFTIEGPSLFARSFALHLDFALKRCGFSHAMA
jgi:REP element-mobilizing transposase RayT